MAATETDVATGSGMAGGTWLGAQFDKFKGLFGNGIQGGQMLTSLLGNQQVGQQLTGMLGSSGGFGNILTQGISSGGGLSSIAKGFSLNGAGGTFNIGGAAFGMANAGLDAGFNSMMNNQNYVSGAKSVLGPMNSISSKLPRPYDTMSKAMTTTLLAADNFLGSEATQAHVDKEVMSRMGGGYGGSSKDASEALANNDKKFGVSSGGARRRASALAEKVNQQQKTLARIDKANTDIQDIGSMSDLNSFYYNYTSSGGYDAANTYAARHGGRLRKWKESRLLIEKLPESKPEITEFKQGGVLNYTIEESINYIIEDPISYIIEDVPIASFKEGGKTKESEEEPLSEQPNVIPEGALHAYKHHMENDENITKKGIPVVDMDGEQQAEIERNEIILNLSTTKHLEELFAKYKKASNSEQDELALEAGILLVREILENTEDNTNLIQSAKNGGILNGKSE